MSDEPPKPSTFVIDTEAAADSDSKQTSKLLVPEDKQPEKTGRGEKCSSTNAITTTTSTYNSGRNNNNNNNNKVGEWGSLLQRLTNVEQETSQVKEKLDKHLEDCSSSSTTNQNQRVSVQPIVNAFYDEWISTSGTNNFNLSNENSTPRFESQQPTERANEPASPEWDNLLAGVLEYDDGGSSHTFGSLPPSNFCSSSTTSPSPVPVLHIEVKQTNKQTNKTTSAVFS